MSDEAVDQLVKDIDANGYAVVPSILSGVTLTRVERFVQQAVSQTGGNYACFVGPEAVPGTGLDGLGAAPQFRKLVRRIYSAASGREAPDQDFYQLLRCLAGAGIKEHSYYFHYDSYVLTVVIPIELPRQGAAGDLIMFRNFRSLRSNYYLNLVDKILIDNPLTQMLLRIAVRKNVLKPTRVHMEVGNAYFFWGYRSLHTNEPCDDRSVRATAVYHYLNPHSRSALERRQSSHVLN